jgi:CTP:molybdopterin cytidylyltransferase MocA
MIAVTPPYPATRPRGGPDRIAMWFAGAMRHATGLLLAAGSGSRMGRPKALVLGQGGEPWVLGAARVLHDGGCPEVVVVVGAQADEASAPVGGLPWVTVVAAHGWAEGMGPSLAAGLEALEGLDTDCAVIGLVDTPDVGAAVVARVLADVGTAPTALGRAAYGGVPGHPVVIGREHWAGVARTATGDRGARAYLAAHPPELVECGDLATGADIDVAP